MKVVTNDEARAAARVLVDEALKTGTSREWRTLQRWVEQRTASVPISGGPMTSHELDTLEEALTRGATWPTAAHRHIMLVLIKTARVAKSELLEVSVVPDTQANRDAGAGYLCVGGCALVVRPDCPVHGLMAGYMPVQPPPPSDKE